MILPDFHDKRYSESFTSDGFVVIDDFLTDKQIEDLQSFYEQHESGLSIGFHASSHAKSFEYRKQVSLKTQQVFTPALNRILSGYSPLYGAFTVKEPGAASFFDFHLDWSMVDETRMASISVWCPLTDVNEHNGHLWVLKGSHRMGRTIRGGPGLTLYSEHPFEELKTRKFEKVELSNKAGQAVVYDHRLFHGSPPNLTEHRRLAINQTYIPSNERSWHFSYDEINRSFNVFEVPAEFYLQYEIGTLPTGVKQVGTVDAKGEILSQDQVNSLVI